MLKNLFGTQEESKNVHCEITGQRTSLENTVILVKIDGVVALKNLNNPSVDTTNRIIKPIGKPPLKYYSELYIPDDIKPLFGKVFTIVNDEDDIEHSTAIMSFEGQKTFSGQQIFPFMEHINNGLELIQIPSSMFFAVIDTSATPTLKTCENWAIKFNGNGRKYRYKKIIKVKRENQTFGIPDILSTGFDVAISDCSQNNPNGTGYMYQTDGGFKHVELCCNESAVSFCKKNNAVIYYNDFLNQGKLRVLAPVTKEINTNLQNPHLFRSSNI